MIVAVFSSRKISPETWKYPEMEKHTEDWNPTDTIITPTFDDETSTFDDETKFKAYINKLDCNAASKLTINITEKLEKRLKNISTRTGRTLCEYIWDNKQNICLITFAICVVTIGPALGCLQNISCATGAAELFGIN
jgi:hypothetical protein